MGHAFSNGHTVPNGAELASQQHLPPMLYRSPPEMPSMMYCPLMRYGMKVTGLYCPAGRGYKPDGSTGVRYRRNGSYRGMAVRRCSGGVNHGWCTFAAGRMTVCTSLTWCMLVGHHCNSQATQLTANSLVVVPHAARPSHPPARLLHAIGAPCQAFS